MQQNIRNSAKINGLIIGGLLSLKFILSAQKNLFLSLLGLMISIMIIVVIYKTAIIFRDKVCGGSIKYKYAFSYIFQIYFFGSIVSSLTILLYTQYIDKTFLEVLLNDTMLLYEKMKIPMDDNSFDMLSLIYKPAPYALLNVLGSAVGGAFWGLVLGAFVKKEKTIFEDKE